MVHEGGYEEGCGGLIVVQSNNEFAFHEQSTILIVMMFLLQLCNP